MTLSLLLGYLFTRRSPKGKTFLRKKLMRSGYSAKVIELHSRQKPKSDSMCKGKRKAVCIRLVVKGVYVLDDALQRIFLAADLHIPSATLRVILEPLESSRLSHFASLLAYQFICIYGNTYIAITDRRLSKQMPKHTPKWLIKSLSKNTILVYCGELLMRLHEAVVHAHTLLTQTLCLK